MALIKIKHGLTLPLEGCPEPGVKDAPRPSLAALTPPDFRYLRPRLKVREGEAVKIGAPLFEDKDDARRLFVSPAGGRIEKIHFGERRRILEVIIAISGEERYEEQEPLSRDRAAALSRKEIVERLLSSGLWPLLRQRPFSRIASPDAVPSAILVSATPADPFDADPDVFLQGREASFQAGLDILARLTGGPLHLCIGARAKAKALVEAENCRIHRVCGPYPSGNPSVQVYHVCPPGHGEAVWYLGAQDVLAVAEQFATGRFPSERIVSLCGPGAKERTCLRARLGASVESLTQGRVADGEQRYVSGGVLTGRKTAATGFLGFYDTMLCVLPEGRSREMLGFLRPGGDRYSAGRAFLSTLFPLRRYAMSTSRRGSPRNFVVNGPYEDVCPVDILPQFLAKAILAEDMEESEKHGILDCAECGLCTFVCPSKIELADIIRRGLDAIVKESGR